MLVCGDQRDIAVLQASLRCMLCCRAMHTGRMFMQSIHAALLLLTMMCLPARYCTLLVLQ